jgi:hypothetical protein
MGIQCLGDSWVTLSPEVTNTEVRTSSLGLGHEVELHPIKVLLSGNPNKIKTSKEGYGT